MRKKLFHGLILSAVLTSGYAWVSLDKTVSVEVDGQPRSVRTFAGTVGGVLDQLDIEPGSHDLVAPAQDVEVKQGSRIVVRRGRQLLLTLNGKTRTVWVTALSVEEALDQLAVRNAHGAFVSASRSRPLPLEGMSLTVRTQGRVNILADGKVHSVITTAPTLKDVFAEARVKLAKTDKVSKPLTALPTDGLTVRVTRVRGGKETENIAVPFGTVRKADPSMWLGETRVVTRGVPGVRVRTWALTYTDKKLTGRKRVGDKLVRKPVTQVIHYGTKRRTVDMLNWGALARCE